VFDCCAWFMLVNAFSSAKVQCRAYYSELTAGSWKNASWKSLEFFKPRKWESGNPTYKKTVPAKIVFQQRWRRGLGIEWD